MPTVHVNLGPRSYDIEIGSGNLRDAANLCDAEQDDAHTIIITDSNVAELYADPVVEVARGVGMRSGCARSRAGRTEQSAGSGGRSVGGVARSWGRSQDGRRGARRRRGRRPGRIRGGDVWARVAIRADSDDAARAGR